MKFIILGALLTSGFISSCAQSGKVQDPLLHPAVTSAPSDSVQYKNGLAIITVTINGEKARFAIDEVSDTTAITPRLKEKLGLKVENVAEAFLTAKMDKRVWVDVVSLKSVNLGKDTFALSPVVVVDVNQGEPPWGQVDGLLGQDFLKKYPNWAQASLK